MRENIDGVVLNDGIYNYLGGRNFIASSKNPVFTVVVDSKQPLVDIAVADIAILPHDDPSELPFVVNSLLTLGNRRLYDSTVFPEQYLPYQFITERLDSLQTDGLSMLGPYDIEI